MHMQDSVGGDIYTPCLFLGERFCAISMRLISCAVRAKPFFSSAKWLHTLSSDQQSVSDGLQFAVLT